jgi:CubicO group peptidase (beta-lactamase class C family)
MSSLFPINGYVKPGFEKVKAEFENNFKYRDELGAACCVYYKGEKVVNLWGGYKNEQGDLWEENTMCVVFSTTKGISSLAFALAVSQGLIHYDEKVSYYWPEFAQHKKENISIRELLSHQAGLCAIDEPLTPEIINDKDYLAKILARQKPLWKTSNFQGYHAWNIGWYQSELVRRTDLLKRSLGKFLCDEITTKLNACFFVGYPKTLPHDNIASIIPPSKTEVLLNINKISLGFILPLLNPWSLASKALFNPPFVKDQKNFNKAEIRSLEMGSGNGIGSAEGIAKIYSEFANQTPYLQMSPYVLNELEKPPLWPTVQQKDLVMKTRIPFSLGFIKPCKELLFGSNENAYGSFGAGGSCGFADPDKKIGFAYVMNKMGCYITGDPREKMLRKSLYDCIQ